MKGKGKGRETQGHKRKGKGEKVGEERGCNVERGSERRRERGGKGWRNSPCLARVVFKGVGWREGQKGGWKEMGRRGNRGGESEKRKEEAEVGR